MTWRLSSDSIALTSEVAGAVVTFEADRKHYGAAEHPRIGGSMRHMAALASVYTNGCVLKQKRSPLVRVALQARLLVAKSMLYHSRPGAHSPRRGRCSVRIVAVAALHNTFVHPVLERHVELRAHRPVAVVTEVRLRLSQQEFRSGRAVDGMAAGTNDVSKRVLRSADFRPGPIFAVAGEAVVEDLFFS